MKKADANIWWIIISAVIVVVVAAVVLFTFRNLFTKEAGIIETQFDSFGDFDKDNIANLFDKCPCTSSGPAASDQFSGCTASFTEEQVKVDQEKFKNQCK